MSEVRENNFETLLTITLKQQKIIEQLEQQKAELLEFAKIAHRVSGLADKEDYGITLLYKKSIELLIKYK